MTKNKEDVTQAHNAGNNANPVTTAETALASPSSNKTVPRNTSIVNNNISKDGNENSEDTYVKEKLNQSNTDNSSIDNGFQNGYNDTSRGERYVRTDEFRDLQAESKRELIGDSGRTNYASNNEGLRQRLSGIFKRQLERSGINTSFNKLFHLNSDKHNTQFNIYEGVDGSLFHDVFEIARNYLQNGELVDLHDIKTTEDGIGYDDCYNYLSEDGLSGFSITPDGDLISVFNASGKRGFLYAIAPIVKERAKTLDCYASEKQNLQEMYQKVFGFKTASVMDYNMEYDHDNIAANHNNPQVAFMVNTGAAVETKNFTKDQYDEAKAYRDSFVDNSDSQSGAKGITEPDISKDTRSYEERVAEMMGGKESQKVKARKFVQSIGKALGVTVVFEDTVERYGEWSDGYIDKNGVIHIDYNNKNPLAFLFRHEMVHYGSGSKFYKQFVNLVYNSKLFREWLQEKTKMPEGTSVDRMAAKYMTMVAKSRKGVEELSETRLQEEMVADFAGSDLFTAGGSGLAAMSTEFDTKQRNVVSQYIADLISWIKKKINKVPGAENLTFELSRLEDTFNRMISDAKQNPTERELKHSIAGIRAKTANLTEQGNAKRAINFGEDSETVRKSTGWWQGKDGEWRFYIPDNEMEFYPEGLVENPKTLGDFLKHDKLFAAYPELKNIKLSFKKMKKSIKGSYNPDTNTIILNETLLNDEELVKNKLIHEMQHAIQVIEGFASGGNEILSQRYAFNVAYNDVKKTQEFKNLKSSEEKRNYVISSAVKMVGAKDEQDLYHKVYKAIYGEEEARYAEKFRYFDEDLLRTLTPVYSGHIINAEQETQKFIDNLKEIGYTESEIEALYGGDLNDKSGSKIYHATANSRVNDGDGLSTDNIVMSGIRNFRNDSEGEGRPDVLGQGISSEISDRRPRRLEKSKAELEDSAFSMNENIRRSVPVDSDIDTDTDIDADSDNDIIADFQKLNNEYNKGNIEEEIYMQRVAELYDKVVEERGRIKKGEVGRTMVLYDIIEFTPTKFEIKKESAPNSLSTVRSGALSNNNIPYGNDVAPFRTQTNKDLR